MSFWLVQNLSEGFRTSRNDKRKKIDNMQWYLYYLKEERSYFKTALGGIRMKKIAYVFSVLLFLLSCDSKTMQMASSSMEPTFKKGESIIINLKAYINEPPKRWDVVVYQSHKGKLWIHRVVGLPGENLIINPDGVYVNGEKLSKPSDLSYISYIPEEMLIDKNAKPPYKEYKIPNDSYFLLGDNSQNSYDSRMVGVVSIDKIKGKVQ